MAALVLLLTGFAIASRLLAMACGRGAPVRTAELRTKSVFLHFPRVIPV